MRKLKRPKRFMILYYRNNYNLNKEKNTLSRMERKMSSIKTFSSSKKILKIKNIKYIKLVIINLSIKIP
jgi:hypothetical protein